MQDLLEKLKSARKNITLSADRKQALRQELVSFINTHPVHQAAAQPRGSFLTLIIAIFRTPSYTAAAIVVVMIVFSGGTALAAHDAQPGQVLYGVKLGFNEKLRSALTFDLSARADYEAHLAQRRLEDKQKLTDQGKTDVELEAQIAANFEEHAHKTQTLIARLSDSGQTQAAIELSDRFTARLEREENATAQGGHQESDQGKQRLGAKVDTALDAALDVNTRLNSGRKDNDSSRKVNTRSAAEGKITAATNVISIASRLISASSNDKARAQAGAQLQAAKEFLGQAQAKFDTGDYNAAFYLAGSALRASLNAKIIIVAEKDAEDRKDQRKDGQDNINLNANASANLNANQNINFNSGGGSDAVPLNSRDNVLPQGSSGSAGGGVNLNF